jgi:hypothetical protein
MRRRTLLAALVPAMALTGCAAPLGPPTLVGSSRQTVNGISVEPQTAWTRLPARVVLGGAAPGEIWTIDGPLLDRLRFHGAVAPGAPLDYQARGQTLPQFRAGMGPSEIAELVTDTVAARGNSDVEMLALAPAPFAGLEGFRLDYRFLNADGLELLGRARGAERDGRLYLIVFEAAADHYFARLAPTVDRLMDSARLV